ncbi:MAG: hypothetical protein AAFW75_05555 [Cyanobacteria bacterium J06636_16]
MVSNLSSQLQPLNVGNVVSAGVSVLRSNFGTYLKLSAAAGLWWLVPVYGWARALMIYGQISRLSFQEVVHQPEPVSAAYQKVQPHMWAFLGTAILVLLIFFGVSIAISFATLPLNFLLSIIASFGDVGAAIFAIGYFLLQIAVFMGQMWIQARFCLFNVIIAVETGKDATASISRSLELTSGSGLRVLLVLIVAYAVMAPIYTLIYIPFIFATPFLFAFLEETQDPVFAPTSVLGFLFLAILLLTALFIMAKVVTEPLWRSIIGVLYHDLRVRREGLDIRIGNQIHDRYRP